MPIQFCTEFGGKECMDSLSKKEDLHVLAQDFRIEGRRLGAARLMSARADADDPLIAVLAEAARLGEAALEAGDQADFGTLIDLAVQAGPSVTSVHSEDTSDVIPSAAEISCATSIADELGRFEAAIADSRASEAEACFARLEAASGALEMRTALRSAGAIAAAVRVLGRSRSNARVQESGCRALARFAGADRQSRVCACEAGAATTARSAIETHPEDALVGDEAGAITLIIATALSISPVPALALAPDPTPGGRAAVRTRAAAPCWPWWLADAATARGATRGAGRSGRGPGLLCSGEAQAAGRVDLGPRRGCSFGGARRGRRGHGDGHGDGHGCRRRHHA